MIRPRRFVLNLRTRPRPVQRSFRFVERSEQLARGFKLWILLGTLLLVGLALGGTSNGRNLARRTATRARWAVLGPLGLEPSREEIAADWRRRRLHDIEQTRGKLHSVYAEYAAPMRKLLDHAGLDPVHALLRWGNFDRTIYLPSTVFEADETGRSYRFRPNVRAVWVRNLRLRGGILAYFPVPIGPELEAIAKAAGAVVVAESVQTTNSWGLRGPEPDPAAPLRGIVLGDSYMQGLFVGDHETPSECLKRFLSERLKVRTEVLNTGHLGYSPEQEYHTLRAYADRFRPRFVVLSLFANDFGDLFEVLQGQGDWEEGRYWLGEITQFCRTRGIELLAVPAPWVNQLESPRRSGFYPGLVSNILECAGTNYLDPIDAFADALVSAQPAKRTAEGEDPGPLNPLFNGRLGDGHFSPLGCQVWARAVGERLMLLLQKGRDAS
jgi:hypothetical protein